MFHTWFSCTPCLNPYINICTKSRCERRYLLACTFQLTQLLLTYICIYIYIIHMCMFTSLKIRMTPRHSQSFKGRHSQPPRPPMNPTRFTCTYIFTYNVYICMKYACIYVYIHTSIYVYTCMCMYIHVSTDISLKVKFPCLLHAAITASSSITFATALLAKCLLIRVYRYVCICVYICIYIYMSYIHVYIYTTYIHTDM